MKNLNKRKAMKKYILTLIVVFAFVGAFAQPGHGGNGGGGHDPAAPIDGGIVLLVVAGAAYGVKRNLKE
jgi:hypothetical protein